MFISKFDPQKCGKGKECSTRQRTDTGRSPESFSDMPDDLPSARMNRRKMPRPDELVRLAEFYGASIDYLLTGKEGGEFMKQNATAVETFSDKSTDKAQEMYLQLKDAGFNDFEIEKFIAMAVEIKKAAR